ncbi:MAG: hypothetical protein JJU03_01595 [Idiomarina sp.]|nr:hypothetical protein [Idiomarina sp.]
MNSRILVVLTAFLLLIGCSPEGHRVSSETMELTVIDHQVRDYRGNVLLTRSQLPNRVRVNLTTEFSAHDRFVRAEMSPNGEYLAVTTVGSAHTAGWIHRIGDDAPRPAAFQYGGGLSIDRWHPASTHLVFRHRPPSGAQLLSVTAVSQLGAHVEDANYFIKVPKHDQLSPQHLNYNALRWEDRGLRFNLGGQRWLYHPDHGVSEY